MSWTGKMKWRQEDAANPLDENPKLFEATLNAFSSQSFAEASLNETMKAAGLNKGSFYYRFYDKMDLYLSLLYRLGMEKIRLFAQYDDEHADGDVFESIRHKAVLGLRFAKMEPRYNAFSRRILAENPEVRRAIRECFGDVTEDVLTGMIEEGKAKGQVRPDVSTALVVGVFSTLLAQIDLMISPGLKDDTVLAQVDELIAVLRDGVAAR